MNYEPLVHQNYDHYCNIFLLNVYPQTHTKVMLHKETVSAWEHSKMFGHFKITMKKGSKILEQAVTYTQIYRPSHPRVPNLQNYLCFSIIYIMISIKCVTEFCNNKNKQQLLLLYFLLHYVHSVCRLYIVAFCLQHIHIEDSGITFIVCMALIQMHYGYSVWESHSDITFSWLTWHWLNVPWKLICK
jgi:hypothetical protein